MGDWRQLSWFEGSNKLSLSNKPIRLIELFGGVGAQANAIGRRSMGFIWGLIVGGIVGIIVTALCGGGDQ